MTKLALILLAIYLILVGIAGLGVHVSFLIVSLLAIVTAIAILYPLLPTRPPRP
jgi:hypothetical protein